MIVLASTSPTRIKLLRDAGLRFESCPSRSDEDEIKQASTDLKPSALAQELAQAKALSLVQTHPSCLIIGADQVLECDGQPLHKAKNLDDARRKLKQLRGKTHHLHSAVACVREGQLAFHHVATASLTMRQFTDGFLEHYLQHNHEAALNSVACYHYEDQGTQLFDKVDGDYHTILGLPLLPLLAFLRQSSILQA